MYAIVATSGKQYRVEQGATITVDRMKADVGSEITLGEVLLVAGDGKLEIGTPHVEGAAVKAEVVSHDKGEKVITFKYKQRKRTRKRNGFRARLTTLKITAING